MARSTPEGRVKAKIKLILKEYGVWFYMPVQNGMGVVGIPDFICCHRGLFLAIEAKAPGKKANLTPNQESRRDEIVDAHGHYMVTDDPEEIRALLEAWSQLAWFKRVAMIWQGWVRSVRAQVQEG